MCLWRKMSSPPDVVVAPRSLGSGLYAEEASNEAVLQSQWGQF
jgi:hypothetical protein